MQHVHLLRNGRPEEPVQVGKQRQRMRPNTCMLWHANSARVRAHMQTQVVWPGAGKGGTAAMLRG
eukprot:350585-Chlamydomonas_euryale.AAC.3